MAQDFDTHAYRHDRLYSDRIFRRLDEKQLRCAYVSSDCGRCRSRLVALHFPLSQSAGKEDESKNQGEAAGRITAITKHYSSRAQSTKIGCAFSLPAPYSEERRRAASEAAKKCGVHRKVAHLYGDRN